MAKKLLFSMFLILGLILVLEAALDAQEPVPPIGMDIQTTSEGDPQDSPLGDDVPRTRWVSLDGRSPTTFAEWQARQEPPSPWHVERVYTSKVSHTSAISGQVVCALVNPAVYGGISASLSQWMADVENEGWTVVVYNASFPEPSALRDHLSSITNLDGCLLIGDFPVPWYEIGEQQFPMDVYYMDLNGTWSDDDLDGLYDEHTGDVAPEIWVGRMTASNLDFGDDEVTLLNNYFAKNHAYRIGDLSLPSRALVYLDDDWAYAAENMGQTTAQLFTDTTVISESNTTTAVDYGHRLVDYYAWVHVFAHSTAFNHLFTYEEGEGPGAIFNENIYEIDPHSFFYNLFACGAARFVERNYLAGWYTFSDTYGLLVIGSSKSGSMVRGFDLFYGPLAEGVPLGQAYREWFAVEGVADQSWHYGLTLSGDPTLTVITEEQVGEMPTSVAITGSMTGVVQMADTFTATVGPSDATQPFRYVWQATDQIPVTYKSGLSDTVDFTWNTPGTKIITVTITNFEGTVTSTHAVTIKAPEIEITPSSYRETVVLGATLTRSLTISNTGQGKLVFDLAETDHSLLLDSSPDGFGYTFRDSNQTDGPVYQWIEIAPPAGGSGTVLSDLPTGWQGGYSWPITLPFTFNFYGIDYSELAISSHGALNFTDRFVGRENSPIPGSRTFEVETFVASLWDALVIDPGAVYYQDLGSMFIIEYYQVSRYSGYDGTWEVILFENGSILFQYQDVDFGYYWGNYGRSATVGIQGDAITGLQYSCNTPALSDGLAICFAYPGQLPDCLAYSDAFWLTESPIGDAVAVDGMRLIDIVFDARGPEVTQPGEYQANLVVITNDPDEKLTLVPVTMTVISPTYDLTLASPFKTQTGDPATSVTYTLYITNASNTFDTFDVTTDGHNWPTTAPSMVGPLSSGAAVSMVVTVDIPSIAAGDETDVVAVTITSQGDNDKWGTATLTTTANSIYGVTVVLITDTQYVNPGNTVTHTLQMTNTGNITDTFDIVVNDYVWPTSAPTTTGPLAAGENAIVNVTVSVPSDAMGGAIDTATVVTLLGNDTRSATNTLTTTVNTIYGVAVLPVTDTQSADPGETVTFTLQVINTGNITDTFNIVASDYVWPTSVPSTVGPLAAGENTIMDVMVSVPPDAMGGATDTVIIIVTFLGDDTLSVSTTLNTEANTIYGVVSSVTDTQSADPGETVTFTLQVTNTGNITDTFDIVASGYVWPTGAPTTIGPLAASQGATVDVTVNIPLGSMGGTRDTVTITITSQTDGTELTTINLITEALIPQSPLYDLFLPLIKKIV